MDFTDSTVRTTIFITLTSFASSRTMVARIVDTFAIRPRFVAGGLVGGYVQLVVLGPVAALADAGPLRGTVLWSCVNALKPDYTGLAIGFDNSAAEEVTLSS